MAGVLAPQGSGLASAEGLARLVSAGLVWWAAVCNRKFPRASAASGVARQASKARLARARRGGRWIVAILGMAGTMTAGDEGGFSDLR